MICASVNLFLLFLGFVGLIAVFSKDVIFLDAQQKALSQKFETWWKIVEHYNKVKLALAFAKKVNELLDSTFGAKHFSKRLVARCSIISSGFLLITLAMLGMTHHVPFGVAPWTAYKDSVRAILTTTDDLASKSHYAALLKLDLTSIVPHLETKTNSITSNQQSNYYLSSIAPQLNSNTLILHIHSNDWLFKVTTNGLYQIQRFDPLGHGLLTVGFSRGFGDETNTDIGTNSSANLPIATNTFEDLSTNLMHLHNRIANYDAAIYARIYSVGFYIVVFAVNVFMFIVSFAFGRTILREIANSRRVITTCALIFTNCFFVFVCVCALVLFLTLLAVPVFWLLVPYMYRVASDSIYLTCGFLLSTAIAILTSIGTSTKIMLFIAMLPSCFVICVSACTLCAIKWREQFHFVVKHLLIRCAEKNPFAVLIGIIALIGGLIEVATKCIHFLGFF
jgi:hypothetical protein